MRKRLRFYIMVVSCILSFSLIANVTETPAQTIDWGTFVNYVFGAATDVVQGRSIEQNSLDEMDRYLIDFTSQNICPKESCESIKYIITAMRNMSSGMGDSKQYIAFLRQAVNDFRTNSQGPVQQGAATAQNSSPQNQSSQAQARPVAYTPNMLSVDVSYVYRPGGTGEPRTLEDKGEMHSGDHYKIIFTPTEDCYIYVFQLDSSGIYGLFPLKSFRGVQVNLDSPAVRGGQTYFLPAQDKSFKLNQQTGPERFYLLVSRERDYELEKDYAQVIQGQEKGYTAEERQVAQTNFTKSISLKGPAVIVSDSQTAEETSWQEGGQSLSVLKQRLTGVGNHSVHILSFTHR